MRRPAPIPILLALTALALLGAANAQGNRPRPTDPFLIVSRQPVVELDLDTPPEAGRSVVLFVIDQDEKPLAGVDVMVLEASTLRTDEAREIVQRQLQTQRSADPTKAFVGVAAELGKRYRTDQDGKVRVAWDKSAQAYLLYRREVTTAILRESDDPLEIGITLPERLTVAVTDHRGKPAAGVLVTTVAPGDNYWSYRFRKDSVRTDQDGIALLEVPAPSEGRTLVLAQIGIRQQPRVEIAKDGATQLQLPPCGTLRVYFEGLEKPLTETVPSIELNLDTNAWDSPRIEPVELGKDFVTFAWVGLGEPVTLTARVDGRGVEGLRLDAPRIPGEMKIAQVPVADLVKTVRIRVVTRDGEPLGRKKIGVFVVQPAREYSVGATTEIDGTVTADVETDLDFENADLVVLSREGEPSTQGFARVPIAKALAAAPEPFRMQLQEEPVLLSGRLLGPDGEPLAGIPVWTAIDLEPANPGGGHSSSSVNLNDVYDRNRDTTDEEGRFTLREPYDGRSTVVLNAELPEGLSLGDQNGFAPGDTDVVVKTTAVGRIFGNFADFPDGVDSNLRVWITPGGNAGRGRTIQSVDDDDGTFEFDDLAPGKYTVELSTPDSPDTVATFPDVVVGPDSTDQPQLKDIDWREYFSVLRITVRDESGDPVGGALVTAPQDARFQYRFMFRAGGRNADGVYRVWAAKGEPRDLAVTHPSYRTVNLEAVDADKTVTLTPRPALRVRLGEAVELPDGLSLMPEVVAAEAGDPADNGPAGMFARQMLVASSGLPGAPEPIALTPVLVRPDVAPGKAVLRLVGQLDRELNNKLLQQRGSFRAEFRRDVTVRLLHDPDGVPEAVFEPTEEEQEQLRTIAKEIERLRNG